MPRLFSGKVILSLLLLLTGDLCLAPALGNFRPVFLYLWVLYIAFNSPAKMLIPAAILAGILRDLSGSQPLGVETLSLAATASALTFLILKFEHEIFLMRIILGALFVFITLALNQIFSSVLAPETPVTWHAFYSSFFVTLASIVCMPFFSALMRKWFPREKSSLRQYELFG